MKKIFTLIGCLSIAATLQTQAQTQRLVLLEEFTNASCGPCAAQNPTLHTLLNNNSTKVVSVKYQTNFPGYDPMNLQTGSEVLVRQNYYYNLSGVPYAVIDGDTAVPSVGGYYLGAPHNIVQSTINSKYAVPAPYDMVLNHSFSADYDSIFVTMTLHDTAAYTGVIKAHIVLVEKNINFTSAPGTNGEKDFYYVMRKMYPNANGTSVTAITVGATQVITIAAPIPAYTYNFNQLAVVGFIQDNVNQKILQAGFSDAQPLADMVGLRSVAGVQTVQCSPNYNPILSIKNLGTTQLTSCSVNYRIDNNPTVSTPITLNIAPGAFTNYSLPQIVSSAGDHTIKFSVSNPNTTPYQSEFLFNTITKKAIVASTFNPVPVVEGFEGSTFPATDWYIDNPDNGPTWTRKAGAGGNGNSTACAKADIFTSANVNGQIDDLYAPALDLTNAISPVTLDFNVAAAQKTTTSAMKLEVRLSFNCGATWFVIFTKTGAVLSTGGVNANAFTPTAAQWRAESIDLDAYIGQPNVLVQFRATKNGGNNIYIDDVNFYDGSLKVKNVAKNSALFNAYQMSENFVNVKLNMDQADVVNFEVYDILGKKVFNENKGRLASGDQSFAYNIENLNAGIYVLRLTAGNRVFNQKINISK